MRGWLVAFASGLITLTGSTQTMASEKLMAYGQHLSQECTSCHRIDGADSGIPSIIGLDADTFIKTLGYYRSGARTNPAMVSVAQSLDEEQIKALALYFASLTQPKATATPQPKR